MKRSQVHPHLIPRTNSNEANNSYVTIETNVRPNSLPLNPTILRTNNQIIENPANENLTQRQVQQNETHSYVNVAAGSNNPYQNVFNRNNLNQDTDSMNSSLTKRNVSFSLSQKVHYYEAESTSSKKPKAGLWLKVHKEEEEVFEDGEMSEVDGSSYSSNSTYEDEYIVTDRSFQNREFPGNRIRVSDVQSFSSDGDFC